jgi:ubiquinol-cytochrome c reductase cytochrome b subunit
MITRRIVGSVDSRLRIASPLRKALAKVFPDHWTFMFGEVALYCFVVLVLTGVFLALFFDPSSAETTYHGEFAPMNGVSTTAAYASALELSYDIRAGLVIRQTHHWAALVFVGAIVIHLCRIFFTGAYRRPREINWMVGVTMLVLALFNGFTGYSMPDDQLSGIGLRIIYSSVQSVPAAGPWLAFLAFGGEFPAEQTIPRMFTAHVFIVPALLTALIGLHLLILVRQKHSQFPGRGRTEHNVVGSRLWPSYTVRTLGLFCAVLAVLFGMGGLAQINPIWIWGPFDPAQSTVPAQPDWYVAWGEGALRLFPPADLHVFGHLIPAPFWPSVALGGFAFVLLYAWPFLEEWATKDKNNHQLLDRRRDHPVRMAVGVGGLSFFALLVVAAGDDIFADWIGVPIITVVWILRVAVLVVPPVAALIAFVLARAVSRVEGGFSDLTAADLRAGLRRAPPEQESGARIASPGRIEIEREADSQWRWRYLESVEGELFRLDSTNSYGTDDQASTAAAQAYPALQRPTATVTRPSKGVAAQDNSPRTVTVIAGAAVAVACAVGIFRRRR